MTQLTPEKVEAYLAEYGWRFEAAGPSVWRTGFQGERRLYPLTITLSQTCISFEVRPLIDAVLDPGEYPDLTRELLELNGKVQLVKVGLAETGEISLSCQVLSVGFDYEHLSRILGIIGYYADEIVPDIMSRVSCQSDPERPTLLC